MRELLARVRALLRRRGSAPPEVCTFAGFALDTTARTLTDSEGQEVRLTRTELDLLAFFLAHLGRALTRQQILDSVWGSDVVVDDRTVDNFVSSLKKKLGWHERSGFCIGTIRGVGYRMEVETE